MFLSLGSFADYALRYDNPISNIDYIKIQTGKLWKKSNPLEKVNWGFIRCDHLRVYKEADGSTIYFWVQIHKEDDVDIKRYLVELANAFKNVSNLHPSIKNVISLSFITEYKNDNVKYDVKIKIIDNDYIDELYEDSMYIEKMTIDQGKKLLRFYFDILLKQPEYTKNQKIPRHYSYLTSYENDIIKMQIPIRFNTYEFAKQLRYMNEIILKDKNLKIGLKQPIKITNTKNYSLVMNYIIDVLDVNIDDLWNGQMIREELEKQEVVLGKPIEVQFVLQDKNTPHVNKFGYLYT